MSQSRSLILLYLGVNLINDIIHGNGMIYHYFCGIRVKYTCIHACTQIQHLVEGFLPVRNFIFWPQTMSTFLCILGRCDRKAILYYLNIYTYCICTQNLVMLRENSYSLAVRRILCCFTN